MSTPDPDWDHGQHHRFRDGKEDQSIIAATIVCLAFCGFLFAWFGWGMW